MNTEAFVTFFLAFIVSALGSVPVGTINLTTMQIAATYGMKQAMKFIAIAAISEIVHVALALWLEDFIYKFPSINTGFSYASVSFVLVIGIINLLKKPVKQDHPEGYSMIKAWFINIFNPFSIPFWLFFTTYLHQNHWLPAHFSQTAYYAGASVGAISILGLYARFGNFLTQKKLLEKINIDRLTGVILVCLGIYKLF